MYELPQLPYPYEALEPYIDGRTVDIHYNKHHRGYLNKLNVVLKQAGYEGNEPLPLLLTHLSDFPIDVRDDIVYNIGGVLNHNLYWVSMTPQKTEINGSLKEKIESQYGSVDQFIEEFKKISSYVVGSGWTFLAVTPDKQLEIINTPNQETPYLYGLTPILAMDLWEHAYYLKYQNNRNTYIDAFFQLIDYDALNKRYEEAIR